MESEKCGDFHLKLAETCGLFITYILYPTNSNYLAISGHFLSLPWGLRKKNGPRLEVDWSHHASCMETRRFQNPCENVQEAPGARAPGARAPGCGAPYGKLDLFHCYTIFGNNDFPGLIQLPSGYLT
jgi:hypothetical protein